MTVKQLMKSAIALSLVNLIIATASAVWPKIRWLQITNQIAQVFTSGIVILICGYIAICQLGVINKLRKVVEFQDQIIRDLLSKVNPGGSKQEVEN